MSHFKITSKNVTALASSVLAYLVLKGRISADDMGAYLLIVGALLAFLVPTRKGKALK